MKRSKQLIIIALCIILTVFGIVSQARQEDKPSLTKIFEDLR